MYIKGEYMKSALQVKNDTKRMIVFMNKKQFSEIKKFSRLFLSYETRVLETIDLHNTINRELGKKPNPKQIAKENEIKKLFVSANMEIHNLLLSKNDDKQILNNILPKSKNACQKSGEVLADMIDGLKIC